MKKIKFKSMPLYFYSMIFLFVLSIFILIYSFIKFGFQEKIIYIIFFYTLMGATTLFSFIAPLYYYEWCEYMNGKFIFKCLLFKIGELGINEIKEIEILNLISGDSRGTPIFHKVICLKSNLYNNEKINYHNNKKGKYYNIAFTEENFKLLSKIYKDITGKEIVVINHCDFTYKK